MRIDPNNGPNEAYTIGHMPAKEHGLPPDWWTVFCNGIPVYHFAPDNRAGADRGLLFSRSDLVLDKAGSGNR